MKRVIRLEIKKILDNIGFDDRKKIMAIKVIISGQLDNAKKMNKI